MIPKRSESFPTYKYQTDAGRQLVRIELSPQKVVVRIVQLMELSDLIQLHEPS